MPKSVRRKVQKLFLMVAVLITAVIISGCSKSTLTTDKVKELIEQQISRIEYRCYISIGEKIGVTAGEPDSFLKDLGLANYVVQKQNQTWYVITSLTEQGKKIFKPVNTIWGPRYMSTIAGLKLDSINKITLSPDKSSAIVEMTLKIDPAASILGQKLDPEKSVFDNHNIHIQCVEKNGTEDSPWGVPKGLPYKVQFIKQAEGWHFAKILEH